MKLSPFLTALLINTSVFISMNALAIDPQKQASQTVIDAASHGMRADAEDNTDALRKALAACAEAPNPRLNLTAGTYRFKTENFGPDKVLALVKDVSNLDIEGNGAQFLLVGDPSKVTGLRFSHCSNVRIANLSVDCEKLPFAQGKIISFDNAKKLVIEIDPKFPLQDDLPVESIVDCDAETGLMLANIDLYRSAIESIEKEPGNRLVVNVKMTVDASDPNRATDLKKLQDILPGEKALIRQSTYGSFMFTFLNSSHITMEDVTVYCFAGMAVHAQESADITLRRFVAAPPKDSGRLLSITKDAIHFTHLSGLVTMEDCHFDAIGDDAFNIYAKFRTVQTIVDPTHLEMVFPLPSWRGPTPEPGEILNFWDVETMDWKGKAEVESATWDNKGKVFKVTLRSPLPDNLQAKDFVNSEKYTPKVEVRRCTFRGMLARALVFSTYDVLVEDCQITATSYSGILFPAGFRHGGQGPASRKIVIRNNVFHGTGGAAIYGYVYTKNAGTVAMSDITIEGNKFETDARLDASRLKTRRPDWLHWSAGICLRNANGVNLSKNTFAGYAISFFLENIQNATVTDNTSNQATLGIINRGSGNIAFERNTNFTLERDQKAYDPDLYYIGILR